MTNTVSKLLDQPFNKYHFGKIYKIVSDMSDMVYIGSTTQELKLRFSGHKSHYKYRNNNLSVFKIFDIGYCSIELIEEYPCNSRTELEKREGWYQLNTPKCINIKIVGQAQKRIACPRLPRTDSHRKVYKIKMFDSYFGKRIKCECGAFVFPAKKDKHNESAYHMKLVQKKRDAKKKVLV